MSLPIQEPSVPLDITYRHPPIVDDIVWITAKEANYLSFDVHAPRVILEDLQNWLETEPETVIYHYYVTRGTVRIVVHRCADATAFRQIVQKYLHDLWQTLIVPSLPPQSAKPPFLARVCRSLLGGNHV
ncbi:hypothetical protein M1116_02370 [Patescibacteria group bacterium]|nr:hypothetical protein [Patescibacteria group bacterium]